MTRASDGDPFAPRRRAPPAHVTERLRALASPGGLEALQALADDAGPVDDGAVAALLAAGLADAGRDGGARARASVPALFAVAEALRDVAESSWACDHPDAREPAAPVAGSRLVLVHGVPLGRAFPLLPGREVMVVGRGPGADVALDHDAYVSARHAALVATEDDCVVLVDMGSLNGTRVNGVRLDPNAGAALAPGDVIAVGHSLLVFAR